MSLEILVAMVVLGVSLVVATVAFSGLSKPARIAGEDAARRRLAVDFPDARFGEGVITADGKAAFFRCADGRVGLVYALGSRFVTRLVARDSVRRLERGEGAILFLQLDDFTFPRLRLEFAVPEDADRLAGWLEVENA